MTYLELIGAGMSTEPIENGLADRSVLDHLKVKIALDTMDD